MFKGNFPFKNTENCELVIVCLLGERIFFYWLLFSIFVFFAKVNLNLMLYFFFILSDKFHAMPSIDGPSSTVLTDTSECPEEARDTAEALMKGLPRSQSERLLAVCKEHIQQERELQEKYHESVFSTLEKIMKSSQSNQLKTLKNMLDRETADVMRKLQSKRHEEVSIIIYLFN